MIKAFDPDRLRYRFWERNKHFAPRSFHHEDSWTHYTYVPGFHPSKPGPRVMAALSCVWGKTELVSRSVREYRKYMDEFMDEPIVWAALSDTKLNWCQQVVGDCTLENIVMSPAGNVYFIDPGYPRGLVCTENDQAKLLQSVRGWEKAAQTDAPFTASRAVVAIYITHLYRLLRHNHAPHKLEWAREEIRRAKDHLDN